MAVPCDPASLEVKFNTTCEDGQFCLEMTVIVNTNIDPEIFVHRQTAETDPTGCPLDHFCTVATSAQMKDLPAGPPGDPFYRKSEAVTCFASNKDLCDAKELIADQIDDLLENWNKLLLLEDYDIVLFPRS
tara:strand:+ start:36 stop:428 length:393 start_codon:yes stop_codon:yes gene_type:complete